MIRIFLISRPPDNTTIRNFTIMFYFIELSYSFSFAWLPNLLWCTPLAFADSTRHKLSPLDKIRTQFQFKLCPTTNGGVPVAIAYSSSIESNPESILSSSSSSTVVRKKSTSTGRPSPLRLCLGYSVTLPHFP